MGKTDNRKSKVYYSLIAFTIVISLFLHLHIFNRQLVGVHVWRQTQTQTTIENFAEQDFTILNPRSNNIYFGTDINRMEFPLMQWLIAGVYKLAGNHLVITRIFSFLTGLFSMLGMYVLARSVMKDTRAGIIALWTLCFSPVFYYYTMNPLPDNFALCFTIWGMALYFNYLKSGSWILFVISLASLSISALCKLPFVVYFILPVVSIALELRNKGRQAFGSCCKKAGLSILFLVPVIAWYAAVIPSWNGNGVLAGMLDTGTWDIGALADILFHNAVSTLPELLINYGSLLFFFAGFFFLFREKKQFHTLFPYLLSCSILVLAYFFFEMNMIAKVHDYYLFPFLPLLFLIVTFGVLHLLSMQFRYLRYLAIFALCVLPLTAYLRANTRWNLENPGFNRDILIHYQEIKKIIPEDSLCIAGEDNSGYIFLYYLHRKGWTFTKDDLSPSRLQEFMLKGAKYLISDSRRIDEDPRLLPHFKRILFAKGALRVIELK